MESSTLIGAQNRSSHDAPVLACLAINVGWVDPGDTRQLLSANLRCADQTSRLSALPA